MVLVVNAELMRDGEVQVTETTTEVNGVSASNTEPLADAEGKPTNRGWRKIGEMLRKPMQTKSRPGRGGNFEYITARQVQDRLDAVIGPGNWQSRFFVVDASGPAVECTITVFGVPKADVGYSNNPDAEHESEPLKAAYSDAFKRAAVQWGVGRFLYGD